MWGRADDGRATMAGTTALTWGGESYHWGSRAAGRSACCPTGCWCQWRSRSGKACRHPGGTAGTWGHSREGPWTSRGEELARPDTRTGPGGSRG